MIDIRADLSQLPLQAFDLPVRLFQVAPRKCSVSLEDSSAGLQGVGVPADPFEGVTGAPAFVQELAEREIERTPLRLQALDLPFERVPFRL